MKVRVRIEVMIRGRVSAVRVRVRVGGRSRFRVRVRARVRGLYSPKDTLIGFLGFTSGLRVLGSWGGVGIIETKLHQSEITVEELGISKSWGACGTCADDRINRRASPCFQSLPQKCQYPCFLA